MVFILYWRTFKSHTIPHLLYYVFLKMSIMFINIIVIITNHLIVIELFMLIPFQYELVTIGYYNVREF